MGVVYMAEQQKPVRRRVALKIIKPGMDSKQVIARFEAERQALAMMDHPNIARVLDAGCTESGRPYFAMELVQGIPITQYCDDKQLNTVERLELFIQVCQAVQHAHQKGIIHRDLKPSNVLIAIYDGKPIPKIIDFGVAKALHQQLTEKTMFTQFGTIVGTLEYMSPEQADMDLMGIDTRSDIYSLGVLLYELLTGTTPLDGKKLRSLGYAEMLKTIREVDPPKPSTRLSHSAHDLANISANRHTEARRLQKLVAGDLDWIVMKCLEKDRTRRYETANGLAMDLQRHLHDEAVSASPPGQLYKLQKMVRRNKLLFTAIGCVMLALVLGLAASLWQADRATRAEVQTRAALARETALRKEAEGKGSIAKALNLCANRDFPGAEKLISQVPEELIQQDPKTAAEVFRTLGNWNGGEQRWKQAAADFQAICFGPASGGPEPAGDVLSMDYLTYAALLIELHDNGQYQKLYASARIHLSYKYGERMLNTFLLSPIKDEQRDVFRAWAARAEQTATARPSSACWSSAALGLLYYRQNHYKEALEKAKECLDSDPPPTCQARAQLILALAYARLDLGEQARNELAKCRDVIQTKFADHLGVGDYDSGRWTDWLIDRILLREAESLVQSLPNSPSKETWLNALRAAGINPGKKLNDGTGM
jgi:tRNA A-37 threonylcarbamoyl transferase component Bud32